MLHGFQWNIASNSVKELLPLCENPMLLISPWCNYDFWTPGPTSGVLLLWIDSRNVYRKPNWDDIDYDPDQVRYGNFLERQPCLPLYLPSQFSNSFHYICFLGVWDFSLLHNLLYYSPLSFDECFSPFVLSFFNPHLGSTQFSSLAVSWMKCHSSACVVLLTFLLWGHSKIPAFGCLRTWLVSCSWLLLSLCTFPDCSHYVHHAIFIRLLSCLDIPFAIFLVSVPPVMFITFQMLILSLVITSISMPASLLITTIPYCCIQHPVFKSWIQMSINLRRSFVILITWRFFSNFLHPLH